MTPRISVIVPAFNAKATLAETLASIAAQSLQPLEVIVVDDGSIDGTAAVARSSGMARVISQANGGVAVAFNTGVAAAQGDYVTFLDADDLWTDEALEAQAIALRNHPAATAIVGQFEEFICPSLSAPEAARFQPRPRQTGWIAGATLLSRRALVENGPFNTALRLGVWIDWFGRARKTNLHVITHHDLVLRRRLHPGSLSTNAAGMRQDLLKIARAAVERRNDTRHDPA
jgi:glycosyltransferase involved in cell wall biosynthesis